MGAGSSRHDFEDGPPAVASSYQPPQPGSGRLRRCRATRDQRRPDGALNFQSFYPNPSKETSDGRFLTYEFDPPSGDRFEVSLDARTSPDQNGSWGTYEVRLLDDDDGVDAAVRFRMVVVP